MKNKGFTLVEVMAIVIIIASIALVSFPVLTSVMKNNAKLEEDTFKENAIEAAKTYCNLNKNYDEEGKCSVSINKLIEESYLDKPSGISYDDYKVKCDDQGKCSCFEKKTAVATLLLKTNKVDVTTYVEDSEASHQMYTFSHPATGQTEALIDYRYIGNDPYNYVDFNCDSTGENCETWRIIGIFTVKNGTKKEQRVKLIRDEALDYDYIVWNSQRDENGNWIHTSDWSATTLNTYLNGEYYDSLNDGSKEMIEPAETYLGHNGYDSETAWGGAERMYLTERGREVWGSHSLTDTHNFALAYPSDYTYTYANGVDDQCYSNGMGCTEPYGNPSTGWMYKSSYGWHLVTSLVGGDDMHFIVMATGRVADSYYNGRSDRTRPVVYLRADVQFEGNHTGSSSDHYQLTLD